MLQALLAGVASINAQQTSMNVIGNDLANVNTTAYKSSQVTFEDMISQTLRGATGPTSNLGGLDPLQFGLGVQVAGTNTNNMQGSLQATNVPTDLAIQGNGYFNVSNGSQVSYSRDGGFNLDATGELVQGATGQKLLGWTADSFGNIDTTQPIGPSSGIDIPLGSLNAVQVTKQATFAGNLNAGALPTDTWSTQVTVYDSLGGAHNLTIEFLNHTTPPAGTPPAGATASWDWKVYDGSSTTGTLIGGSTTAGNTPLYFDGNGNSVNALAAGTAQTVTVPASGATPAFTMDMNFGSMGQLYGSSTAAVSNQNGFPPGSLSGYSIGADGVITGLFTNGLTRPLGQIAMTIFPNPGGLQREGSNLWGSTDNSGIAEVGQPNTNGRGSVSSGFLEQSNIDIGSEFTNLIVTQRGFQANTKVVTTVDQMLQDLINMKQ